jgi:hypothetical protein
MTDSGPYSIQYNPVFHVCSTSEPSQSPDVSVLFLMFPVFLVV